ncbi:TfoX/Sxy family DNA transformation protein [Vibrio cholerae]
MDMIEQLFIQYIAKFGDYYKRSMFGGVGLFKDDAMFVLISDNTIYLRGGSSLDQRLMSLGCEKYVHVKKQTTATVNYYDITGLFESEHPQLDRLIHRSLDGALAARKSRLSPTNKRLRDLPNMQLTLERMVKKAGIDDVDTFVKLGAPTVYAKVKKAYGSDVDVKLLWKFAGAIDGIHWKLIQEPRKQQLLESCL